MECFEYAGILNHKITHDCMWTVELLLDVQCHGLQACSLAGHQPNVLEVAFDMPWPVDGLEPWLRAYVPNLQGCDVETTHGSAAKVRRIQSICSSHTCYVDTCLIHSQTYPATCQCVHTCIQWV